MNNRYNWCIQQPLMLMPSEIYPNLTTYINPYAFDQIIRVTGKTPVINIGSQNELTDENGRYWIAVGPNVVNPYHDITKDPAAEEMYGKGVLDVVLSDAEGKYWYLPAIVGGTKQHTYPNGNIQTWENYKRDVDKAHSYFNTATTVEFIGPAADAIRGNISDYRIEKIIFYSNSTC